MTADWYMWNILEEHVLPYVDFISYDNFVLMNNNAHADAARTVIQYFEVVGIEALEWSPISQDANPGPRIKNRCAERTESMISVTRLIRCRLSLQLEEEILSTNLLLCCPIVIISPLLVF